MKFVVFDVETSGLDETICDVLSIGWIVYDTRLKNSIVKHVEYFNNDLSIQNNVVMINKITIPQRRGGMNINTIIEMFKNDIRGLTVYAFNNEFDCKFVMKYDRDVFKYSIVKEICIYEKESVMSAIQRINCEIYPNLDHKINLPGEYHSAYTDALAELIILLYDVLNIDVKKYFIEEKYVPIITFKNSKYYKLPLINVCNMHKDYIEWLYDLCHKHENLNYMIRLIDMYK